MWIFVMIIVVIIGIYLFVSYNSFIQKRNRIKQAESGIDVYLTQRFDLIPNLVECVKAYCKHEDTVLTSITNLRQQYYEHKSFKQAEELNEQCNHLLAMGEAYPALKANEQFLNLQKNLTKMESQLQAARRIYNAEVTNYNNSVEMFPSNVIAKLFHFKAEELFEAQAEANDVISLKIETRGR